MEYLWAKLVLVSFGLSRRDKKNLIKKLLFALRHFVVFFSANNYLNIEPPSPLPLPPRSRIKETDSLCKGIPGKRGSPVNISVYRHPQAQIST